MRETYGELRARDSLRERAASMEAHWQRLQDFARWQLIERSADTGESESEGR